MRGVHLIAFGVLVLAFGAADTASARQTNTPNILFIFADDMTHDAIHALGNTEIETPNLDRLVRRGTTFTHTYNMGSWSGAVCVASRTMLNTGRFLWRANAVYNTSEQERQDGRFWSEILRRGGYETYFTGKWHVKANAEKAFDVAAHVRGGMPNQTDAGYNRPLDVKEDPWSPYDPKFGGFWQGGKHWSEVVADDALEFLKRARPSRKPFFMYIAFNAPHDPRQSPKEYVDKYPLDKVRLPSSFLPEYPFKDAIGCGKGLRDEKLAPFPRTEHSVKVHRQEYYAIITHMDAQIGRILDGLEASGMADDTTIFFTADHGLAVGHHGLFGKQNMYEHSVRVPFIAAGAGIPEGKKIDMPIYLQDVVPTSFNLAEVRKPNHVEFKDLMPLMYDRDYEPHQPIYGAYLQLQRMVIDKGHQLILYPQAKRARLYNLTDDPLEEHDLAEDPDNKPLMKRLFAELIKVQKQMDDPLDLKSSFPDLL